MASTGVHTRHICAALPSTLSYAQSSVSFNTTVLMPLQGFVGAIGRPVPLAAQRIYQLSFFTGLGVSFVVYVLLNKLAPTRQATAEEAEDVFEPWNEQEGARDGEDDSSVDGEAESKRSIEKEKSSA